MGRGNRQWPACGVSACERGSYSYSYCKYPTYMDEWMRGWMDESHHGRTCNDKQCPRLAAPSSQWSCVSLFHPPHFSASHHCRPSYRHANGAWGTNSCHSCFSPIPLQLSLPTVVTRQCVSGKSVPSSHGVTCADHALFRPRLGGYMYSKHSLAVSQGSSHTASADIAVQWGISTFKWKTPGHAQIHVT